MGPTHIYSANYICVWVPPFYVCVTWKNISSTTWEVFFPCNKQNFWLITFKKKKLFSTFNLREKHFSCCRRNVFSCHTHIKWWDPHIYIISIIYIYVGPTILCMCRNLFYLMQHEKSKSLNLNNDISISALFY